MLALNRAADDARAAFETGRQLLASRDAATALACFTHAKTMGFDADQCSAQSWFCHMLLGEYERAWQQSDEIARRGSPDPHAWWDGKPITTGTLMIRCLHGLGDTIQFIRYTKLLRHTASRVVLSAPPCMVSLLELAEGVDAVCGWETGAEEPPFDQQIEINELPRIFRSTVPALPAEMPYFRLPASGRGGGGALRVGLCWSASDWDTSRCVPLPEIARLRAVDGVALATLQFGRDGIGKQLADPSKPVLNTALAIRDLDLVISVDTMVAHLAGALGKPVWILLPFAADWRWMLNRETSPWYPTARLFRQSAPGEWASVVDRTLDALKNLRGG